MKTTKTIINCTVFDGIGSSTITQGAVLIEGKTISYVGKEDDITITEDTEVIDAQGGFVLPGLINAHDHLSWDYFENETPIEQETLLNRSDGELAIRGIKSGINSITSGVTTVRNCGDVRFVDLDYRRAFQKELFPGPRILASGPWVVTSYAWITYPGIPTCDGVEEVRKFVRTNLRRGVDLIKIFIGGELLGLCNTNPQQTYISKEELATAIKEAHFHGKKATAHIMSSQSPGFKWAVDAGIDTLDHGIWFTEEDFKLMKSEDIDLVVTGGWWFEGGFADDAYPNAKDILKEWYHRVFNSGVRFAIGPDGRGEVGAMQSEIERLVNYGLDTVTAVQAATKNGAKVCGMENMIGTLEVGKYADILIVDGNPLDRISDLRNIHTVIVEGKTQFTKKAGLAINPIVEKN